MSNSTDGYVNTIKIEAIEFVGQVFSSNPIDCPINVFELIHSPTFDEDDRLDSYVPNDLSQFSLDSSQNLFIDTSASFDWITIYLKFNIDTTYGFTTK